MTRSHFQGQNQPSNHLEGRIHQRPWSNPTSEQAEGAEIKGATADFSHVDLFSHAPIRGAVQTKLNMGNTGDHQEKGIQKVSDPEISKIHQPANLSAAIQRRLPAAAAEQMLEQNWNQAEAAPTLSGMKRLIRLTLNNTPLPPPLRGQINQQLQNNPQVGLDINGVLQNGTWQQVKVLSGLLRQNDLTIQYPGVASSQTVPQGQAAQAVDAAAQDARDWMYHIANGNADAAINQVFCHGVANPGVRLNEIKQRFGTAGAKIEQLRANQGILSDLSGEGVEMAVKGKSPFGGPIIIRGTPQQNWSTILTICHEGLHAEYQDILDEGGYPGEGGFIRRTADEKKANASHYEEIVRRASNQNPVGGTFIPANNVAQGGIDQRTNHEKATDEVTDTFRKAWVKAQNVHGLIKVDHQQGFLQKDTLRYFSTLMDLTYHQRDQAVGHPNNIRATQIDLLIAEAITRKLNEALGLCIQGFAHIPAQAKTVNTLKQEMEDYIIQTLGSITGGSLNREKAFVQMLAAPPFNPAQVVGVQPPVLPP